MSDKPRRDRGQKRRGFETDRDEQPFHPSAGNSRSPINRAPPAAIPAATSSARMIVGTVRWFNATKGFGFIAPDGGSQDIFLHISVLKRSNVLTVAEGQRVEVEVVSAAKGLEARSLKIV